MNEKIFVIEDDKLSVIYTKNMLENLGYQFAGSSASGEDAIIQIENKEIDLILVDIDLEGKLDGIETTEKIHKKYDIPIIYITSHIDKSLFQRAKITDPFGYILKPVEEHNLSINIEIALYKQEMEKKLKNTNDELEKRVKERTKDLVETNAALKENEEKYRILFNRIMDGAFLH